MKFMHNYMRYLLCVTLFSVVFQSTPLQAQSRRSVRQETVKSRSDAFLRSYQDSLTMYKMGVDSLVANDSLRNARGKQTDDRLFRLFTPLNFYHNVAGDRLRFGTNGNDTLVGKALMNIYLTRPDLVRYTDTKLQQRENASGKADASSDMLKYVDLKTQISKPEPTKENAAPVIDKPIDMFVAKPNFWKFSGDYYLQFMQNYVTENWHKGGSNNYSLLGTVTLQYNYNNKQKVKWDNKLEMKLGLQNSESDTINKFKAVEDMIRLTSSIGLRAHKDWYYTMTVIANTQFAQGRKNNNTRVYSDFMSPFNLNVSLGMDYTVNASNNRLTGKVKIAPLAYNLKFVDRLNLAKSFGLEEEKHSKSDYGSQVLAELTWKPWDMFKWSTRFYAYTTYEKFLLEWENTLTFQFNKYISTNVFLHPRFDDSAKRKEGFTYWQFKEYISLGFSYSM